MRIDTDPSLIRIVPLDEVRARRARIWSPPPLEPPIDTPPPPLELPPEENPAPPPRLRMRALQAVVADCAGMPVAALYGPGRTVQLVRARHVAIWLARQIGRPAPTLPEIGRRFRRAHTAVMHALRATRARLAAGDPATVSLVACVLERLRALGFEVGHVALPRRRS